MVNLSIEHKTHNNKLYSTLERITIGTFVTNVAVVGAYALAHPEAWKNFGEQTTNSGNDWTYAGIYFGFNLLLLGATVYFSRKSKSL